MLASQLQDLRNEDKEREDQLQTYARMQEALTARLHEAQAQELASQVVRRLPALQRTFSNHGRVDKLDGVLSRAILGCLPEAFVLY